MPKQLGVFPIGGTMDNVTFYQTADGKFAVRKKTSLSGSEIATLPTFERTRETNREFGRAGKAAKALRDSLKPMLVKVADRTAFNRLLQRMMQIIQTDPAIRGERTAQGGDLTLMKPFDFNTTTPLSAVFAAPYTATIDRVVGSVDVSVPAFNPTLLLVPPTGATHFKIQLGGSSVNFTTGTNEANQVESAFLPISNAPTTLLNLSASLTPNTTGVIFLALAIRYYKDILNVKYALNSNDAVAIVEVDQ